MRNNIILREERQIKIVDVTLREGDQAPFTSFNAKEKSAIALMFAEMGIDVIEVGFGASRVDFENIQKVSEVVGDRNTVISSLGRALENDTIASLKALKKVKNPRIHIFLAMSQDHINGKFGKFGNSLKQRQKKLLSQAVGEVKRAKKWEKENGKKLEIEFSPEDATGNALIEIEGKKYFSLENNPDFDFLVKVCVKAIKAGATIINVPDTLGNLLPNQTYEFFKELNSRLDYLKADYNFGLSCHIHNDLAMATANAIESVRGGADYIESTMLGIGERAGNTVTEEVIGIITEKGHDLESGIEYVLNPNFQTELLGPVSDFVRRIVSLNKSLQRPFVGALSDIDGSGVHNANGDLYGGSKNKKKFGGASLPEFFSPRGGANQVVSMLEKYGIIEDKRSKIIQKITQKACNKAEKTKALYGANIYAMYMEEKGIFIEDISVHEKQVFITLNISGEKIIISGTGEGKNGPINATINAINDFLGKNIIDVENIKIINKPSLREAIDRFYEDVDKTTVELTGNFREKIKTILGKNTNGEKSKQIGVSYVKLKIGEKKEHTVANGYNVEESTIRAIIEGVLPEILKKIQKNIFKI